MARADLILAWNATGKYRSHSDIDLVIHGAVGEAAIDRLRTLFIESNLPVSVDIFSYEGDNLPASEGTRRRGQAAPVHRAGPPGAEDRSMKDRRGSLP